MIGGVERERQWLVYHYLRDNKRQPRAASPGLHHLFEGHTDGQAQKNKKKKEEPSPRGSFITHR